MMNVIRLTVEFENDELSTRATFDSSTQETTIDGAIYPSDLSLLSNLVTVARVKDRYDRKVP
jgi:hypothetical protein